MEHYRLRRRTPADVERAGAALTFALRHDPEAHGAVMASLVEKYGERIDRCGDGDPRGYLVQLVAESFGVFCDRTAAGFAAWVALEVIQCPGCEAEMNLDPMGDEPEYVCPSCGYREKR